MKAGRLLGLAALCVAGVGTGCATLEVAAAGGTIPEPDPAFLVEVTQTRPETSYLLVVGRLDLDPLDRRPLLQALTEEELESLRTMAAAYGAERLYLEESSLGERRRVYGLGLSTTRTSHLGMKAPACSGAGMAEAKARAARRAKACLQEITAKRRGFKATVDMSFRVGPFGALVSVDASEASSKDSQARACVEAALASVDYPRPPGLFCVADLRVNVP